MRIRVVLSFVLAAAMQSLVSMHTASALAQGRVVQVPNVQVQSPALSDNDALKNVRVKESSGVATGVLPDLTIKDMCLDVDPTRSSEYLRVLLANIGTRSADPFELGVRYFYSSPESGYWYVDKLEGLNAGEEKWLSYSPMCCGVSPIEPVVKSSVKFEAIADPTYLKSYGGYDPRASLIQSRIKESNEGNNVLTINRADMRSCKDVGRPALPRIQINKPVRP